MGKQWIELCRQDLSKGSLVLLGGRPAIEKYNMIEDVLAEKELQGFLAKPEWHGGEEDPEVVWTVQVESDAYRLEGLLELDDYHQLRIKEEIRQNVGLIWPKLIPGAAEGTKGSVDEWISWIGPPDDSFIYVLNGKPVIAGWGVQNARSPETVIVEKDLTGETQSRNSHGSTVESKQPKGYRGPIGTAAGVIAVLAVLGLAIFAAIQSSDLAKARQDLQEKEMQLRQSWRPGFEPSAPSTGWTEKESTIKQRVTEATVQLTCDWRWKNVTWRIEIPPDAPEEAKRNQGDYISFLHEPESGGSVVCGPIVFLRLRPDVGQGFRANVVASDPRVGTSVATVHVGGTLKISH